MSQIIIDLAKKAGIVYLPQMEKIGGRSFLANMEQLTMFAKLVARTAREDERNKLKGST
tara:strand:+ start:287 stop:463 length:177 start_codon:yes stop_codon:yes gene_type:complete